MSLIEGARIAAAIGRMGEETKGKNATIESAMGRVPIGKGVVVKVKVKTNRQNPKNKQHVTTSMQHLVPNVHGILAVLGVYKRVRVWVTIAMAVVVQLITWDVCKMCGAGVTAVFLKTNSNRQKRYEFRMIQIVQIVMVIQ